jgi:hypothetical protein
MIFTLLETLPTKQKHVFAAMVWSIWKHQNLKVWADKTKTATAVERARVMFFDWHLANTSLPDVHSVATAGSAIHVSSNAAATNSSAANLVGICIRRHFFLS